MQPQQGAIGQAVQQLNPRGQTAMKDMVSGREPVVPMNDRVRLMGQMRGQVGDEDMNKLIEQLLMQEAPRLDAEQGNIGGLMQMLKQRNQPQLSPQDMLHKMRQRK